MASDGTQGGWLKRLFGSEARTITDLRITQELAYLDTAEPGLTGKAAAYILTGEPVTVLASLDALSQQVQRARDGANRTNLRRSNHAGHMPGRRQFILNGADNLDRAARYVRVLVLTDFLNAPPNQTGSDKMPILVKTLILAIGSVSYGADKSEIRLPPDDLLRLFGLLGGGPADLVDYVLASFAYALTPLFGSKDRMTHYALSLPAEQVIEGVSRHTADAFAKGIDALTTSKIASDPAYLDFLIDALGAGAGKVRDAARAGLKLQDQATVTDRIVPLASAGKAATRTSAIQMLGDIGTEAALAALRNQRGTEKTQGIQMLLDQILSVDAAQTADGTDPSSGYLAADGSVIRIPARRFLPARTERPFGKSDLATLAAVDAKLEAKFSEHEAGRRARGLNPISRTKVTMHLASSAPSTGKAR